MRAPKNRNSELRKAHIASLRFSTPVDSCSTWCESTMSCRRSLRTVVLRTRRFVGGGGHE